MENPCSIDAYLRKCYPEAYELLDFSCTGSLIRPKNMGGTLQICLFVVPDKKDIATLNKKMSVDTAQVSNDLKRHFIYRVVGPMDNASKTVSDDTELTPLGNERETIKFNDLKAKVDFDKFIKSQMSQSITAIVVKAKSSILDSGVKGGTLHPSQSDEDGWTMVLSLINAIHNYNDEIFKNNKTRKFNIIYSAVANPIWEFVMRQHDDFKNYYTSNPAFNLGYVLGLYIHTKDQLSAEEKKFQVCIKKFIDTHGLVICEKAVFATYEELCSNRGKDMSEPLKVIFTSKAQVMQRYSDIVFNVMTDIFSNGTLTVSGGLARQIYDNYLSRGGGVTFEDVWTISYQYVCERSPDVEYC